MPVSIFNRLFAPPYVGEYAPLCALFFSDIVSFVNLITNRRASFTASSFGKVSLTSLSNRTKLVPSWKRSAYLPWTPSLSSSRRSYSERRSSLLSSLDFLFICLSLCTGKPSCTYYANSLVTFGMSNHQESTHSRGSECDEPILLIGMIWIKDSDTQRVPQDSSSFSESNAMLPQVHLRFGRVPFELYHALPRLLKVRTCTIQ